MTAAREAVAAICIQGDDIPYRYYGKADEILAALRPFIAAEIRAWAESCRAPGGELHCLVEELGVPGNRFGYGNRAQQLDCFRRHHRCPYYDDRRTA